jgi:hypothetical protein
VVHAIRRLIDAGHSREGKIAHCLSVGPDLKKGVQIIMMDLPEFEAPGSKGYRLKNVISDRM